MRDFDDIDDRPVYMISVAAKLTGMHPQTLRIYERKELLRPGRTEKSTRLYSQRDISRLKYIQQLTHDEGVNLAGVKKIMELQNRLENIEKVMVEMETQISQVEARLEEEATRARSHRRELVWVPKGRLMKR